WKYHTVNVFSANFSFCVFSFVFVSPMARKATIARTSSSECGAHLVETTSSNGCNRLCYSGKERSSDTDCLSSSPDDTKRMAGY
ncbi:hypothetical protein ASZ78_014640, partial [Callipepla squamata]